MAFERSHRFLEAQRVWRGALILVVLGGLVVAWVAWAVLGQVRIYAVSEDAKLERLATHPAEAEVAGRVESIRVHLGQSVRAGEVLIELEASRQELEAAEAQSVLEALSRQLEVTTDEIEARRSAQGARERSGRGRVAEASALRSKAAATASMAREDAAAISRLEDVATDQERRRAGAYARESSSALSARRHAVARMRWESEAEHFDREAEIARLGREAARLRGEIAHASADLERFNTEIERHKVRAPVGGEIGELSSLQTGSMVDVGSHVASIVPAGELKVLADFDPAAALGRVRPGQSAQLRLHGFPWTQYGTVAARVTAVASEARDGRIRVELTLLEGSSVPLQHGLPATVQVEIESVPPWVALLRSAGWGAHI